MMEAPLMSDLLVMYSMVKWSGPDVLCSKSNERLLSAYLKVAVWVNQYLFDTFTMQAQAVSDFLPFLKRILLTLSRIRLT